MLPEINIAPQRSEGPKKSLLFVVTQSEFGGAQRFLFELLSRLDRSQYDLALAAGITGDKSFLEAIRELNIPIYLLPALTRNANPFQDVRAVFEIRDLVKKIKPDTLFLNSSKAGFIGSLAAKLSGLSTKVVYRIGGWSFNDPWPQLKKDLWLGLERFSAGWKDVIVVNSTHDFEQAQKLKIKPRETLARIMNGIDPYRIELLPRDQARQDLFTDTRVKDLSKKKVIGTIANFYPTKGLTYLIEAAAKISEPDTVFCIIGEGTERPELEQLIEKHHLEDKVILAGRRAQASRYLSAFDVFVLPSVKEGFPWVLLEAMSARLPVVATNVGAVPEIIEDGVNGYRVAPGQAEALAKKIEHILKNERNAQEMGIQAHQKVLFSFPVDNMVREIEQVL